MDIWKDLWPLRKNKKINNELITFGVLWDLADGKPGCITVSVKTIAKHFNRDGASIRKHLEKLARLDIIRLIARNSKGEFYIEVFNPCPGHAEKEPDPQMLLPLEWTDGVESLDSIPGYKEQPADLSAGIGGDAEGARRGGIPASSEESEPAGNSPSGPAKDRGEFPVVTNPRGVPRGEFPVARATEKNPVVQNATNSAENVEKDIRGEFPAAESARGLRHYKDNEERNINSYNGITNSKDNVSNVVISREAPESPRGEIPAAEVNLARLVDQRRRTMERRQPSDPTAIGDMAFAAAVLSERSSPAAQKERLIARLRSLVADRETKQWLYGFASDLLLVHGTDSRREDAGMIYGKMEALLRDMEAFRDIERQKSRRPVGIGRWLNTAVHKIAEAHGIETPRQRKMQRGHETLPCS